MTEQQMRQARMQLQCYLLCGCAAIILHTNLSFIFSSLFLLCAFCTSRRALTPSGNHQQNSKQAQRAAQPSQAGPAAARAAPPPTAGDQDGDSALRGGLQPRQALRPRPGAIGGEEAAGGAQAGAQGGSAGTAQGRQLCGAREPAREEGARCGV